ncbi:MAG: ATP-dependent Clp protease ATP-binding subunit ClpA, partial [Proteobacteria bacterium]|nr:ATP-dependent Clp protease ATP-binding subunit ClpA [Pseudomonadota bacterium]
LDVSHIERIVDKLMIELEHQLTEPGIKFQLSGAARSWLVNKGYDRDMGARPMQRAIDQHLKKPLVDDILFGELKHGGLVKVDVDEDKLTFSIETDVKQTRQAEEKAD